MQMSISSQLQRAPEYDCFAPATNTVSNASQIEVHLLSLGVTLSLRQKLVSSTPRLFLPAIPSPYAYRYARLDTTFRALPPPSAAQQAGSIRCAG